MGRGTIIGLIRRNWLSAAINIKCKHPIDYLAFIVSLIRILNSNNDDEYRVQMTPS